MVNPSFPDTFWSFKHALKFVNKKCAFPPLGLLTVANMLPESWEARLVDVNIESLCDTDLAWADYVLIGGMTVQRESAKQIIPRCKAAGLPVIAGGPLFTCEPEGFPEVDHLLLNEGEMTLPMFLDDLRRGETKRVYRSDEFPDIRTTPAPRWELLKLERYAAMNVQYSRGCPFNCDFCNVTSLFGHKPRTKSAEQIIDELDGLYRLGWRGRIFFVDDNLIGNKKKLKKELLPALIEWRKDKRHIHLLTEVSINLADDDELMRMMTDAGFDTVFVGIETPADEGLHECNKKQNRNRDLAADIRKMHRAGLQVQGGFIIGFDSDTPSIFQRQIDFIQSSGVVTAMVGLLQAIPGTTLHSRMQEEGRLIGQITGDNVDGTTNIQTRMPPEVLQEGYRRVMNQLYAPRAYARRVRTFLRDYRMPRSSGDGVTIRQLAVFARSIVYLGIFSRERLDYWKLVGWTLFRRPRSFPLAVTLWICGHHFRQVCQLRLGARISHPATS
ncbi:MAG: B12-binding domain-containing radical SAM protein [Phycisphaeraceae bacterium]